MAYELRDFSDVAPATTVASDITNVSTTITLASGTGYPSGGAAGDFIVQIESELIRCSSRSGTSLTVSGGVAGRGINGTTAVGHVSGVAVNHVHTAVNDSKEANYAVSKTVGKVTTSQDLLVADAVNSFTRLGIGANGTILQALAGAVAYGALPANSVGASQITDGTVGSAELAAGAVTAGKIGVGGVSAANQFAAGVVDSAAIANLTIVAGDIANATITDTQVAAANKDGAAGVASMRTLSTTSTTACAGNDARLSDSRAPTGAASGAVLSGTYPSPGIAAGKTLVTTTSSNWTPVFKNGSAGGLYTTTTITAKYIQIGPLVQANFICQVTAGGGSSRLQLTLPVAHIFTSNDTLIGGLRLVDPTGTTRLSGSANAYALDSNQAFYDVGDSAFLSLPTIAVGWYLSGTLGYLVA